MIKSILNYFAQLFAILGGLVTLILFLDSYWCKLNDQGLHAVLFFGVITIFYLTYNFYLKFTHRRIIKYSTIFEELNLGFTHLHKIDRNNSQDAKEIGESLGYMCNSVSAAFTKVHDHDISTCIKILTYEDKRPYLITLIRDSKSTINGRKSGKGENTKHWLDENSDFYFIYSNYDNDSVDNSYYFKKLLPLRKDYRNTRLVNWPPKSRPGLDNLIRIATWPLKYRSTIVVPIVPLIADEQQQKTIRGFLCVDSPRFFAFSKKVDIEILKGIADGLYKPIDILYKLM